MKAVAVSDAFMVEAYYRKCFASFPQYDLQVIPFGLPTRAEMRPVNHLIERGGPYAVKPPEELCEALRDADVLMVHMCPVPAKLLDAAPRLKAVLVNRGGMENVDIPAATERGIAVLNNPAHNANSVAELTIALMLSETRNLARTHRNLMEGRWVENYRNAGHVFDLRGRTVGLLGFGNIGPLVARKLQAFDCEIRVWDPFISPDKPELALYGCRLVDKETALDSDIVSLHVRSDSQVLTREDIAKLKPGCYFINTARPHLIDNQALYEALRDGRVMGAAFDVFMEEPISPDNPYLTLDNVTLSNHRGGVTENCYSDSPAFLLGEMENYRAGRPVRFFVNERELAAKRATN